MTSKFLGLIRRGLFITLIASAALASKKPANAVAAMMAQANVSQSSSNQSEVKALIERADKLITERQFSAAEATWQQILAINTRVFGPDHPEVAKALHNLAYLLSVQGKNEQAEYLYRRSLSINEKSLSPEDPGIANSLTNLASLLSRRGQYSKAESLYSRSLSILEKKFGPDHPDVALALKLLGSTLREQSKYSQAKPLLNRSLEILEKMYGKEHAFVADALTELAGNYRFQGDHSNAETLFYRALVIYEKKLGIGHPYVAVALSNLAVTYNDQFKYKQALPLLEKSLLIAEMQLSSNPRAVTTVLNNLAINLDMQGFSSKAEALYLRALRLKQKVLDENNPDIALSLNNLAGFLQKHGRYSEAAGLFKGALNIYQKNFGNSNWDVATTAGNLAVAYSLGGQHKKAIYYSSVSLDATYAWIARELADSTSQQKRLQVGTLGNSWQVPFYEIGRDAGAIEYALLMRLNRQGLLLEIERQQALKALQQAQIDSNAINELKLSYKKQSFVSALDHSQTALNKNDNKRPLGYPLTQEQPLKLVTSTAIANSLPPDGVLVEFQLYRPLVAGRAGINPWREPQYIAIILKPDGSMSSVQLGPAAIIDLTIHKSLANVAENLEDGESVWHKLSTQVVKPLLPHLNHSRQWFISPDGELNRIPFAALPAPQDPQTPLGQTVQLRLLTTGRELVRLQQPTRSNNQAVVVANPSYDRSEVAAVPAIRHGTSFSMSQHRSGQLGSTQWKPLPSSELEGQQVAQLLNTRLISGTAASTTTLRKQQSPRVLHVATHGFFVADQNDKLIEPLRGVQNQTLQPNDLRGEDPQLRSGLVFAGANQPDVDPNDDGYLTAAEAATLNLKGTELVVLSACSTGQGDVRTGEGVYGLQRSLTVAGARSTLLSLWKVDDAATAEFMRRYYQRLKAGEARSDALAAVQKEFREGKVGDGKWKNPYYWAAWQLVGDWRPIKGL